jgi:hypothetical protein
MSALFIAGRLLQMDVLVVVQKPEYVLPGYGAKIRVSINGRILWHIVAVDQGLRHRLRILQDVLLCGCKLWSFLKQGANVEIRLH